MQKIRFLNPGHEFPRIRHFSLPISQETSK
jgi:hypothetical protein